MKAIRILLATATLSVALALTSAAQEYRTLLAGSTLTTNPTDIIEITAHGSLGDGTTASNYYLEIKLPSVEITQRLTMHGGSPIGYVITGTEYIKAYGNWVTVKISPAPSITPTQPTNAAVIPNDATGNYQVILESSTDLVTWNPANPGTYGGNTPARFFRTRIVKLP